ncbi:MULTISPECIES: hypothetical protein [Bacillaceae]|uniref:hypothetical protein n=1 Tax=Shouchella oshimensis TaxID=290588 RepID=UPI0006EC2FD7|nr:MULTISPECIES: hypothetical protein [Bacillaceae]
MAKFRKVQTKFWDDPKVTEELTPEDKLFFLYLLTNKHTTQTGIYELMKKVAAFEIGYSPESIKSLFDRFINHHKLIKYNDLTKEIAIKNWGKYNLNRGGKPVEDCVKKELSQVKDKTLIEYVSDSIENQKLKTIYDTYSKAFHDTYHDTSEKIQQEEEKEEEEKEEQKEEEKKNLYFDFVKLTESELNKLVDDLGKDITRELMIRLNDYIGSTGRRYKSHYFTIKSWSRKGGVKVDSGNSKGNKPSDGAEYDELSL